MTDDELQRLVALDGAPGPALAIDAARADAIVDAALAGAGFGPGGGGHGGAGGASGGGAAAGMKLAIIAGAVLVVVAIALLAGRALRRSPEQLATPMVDAPTGAGDSTATPARPPVTATADQPPAAEPPLVDMSDADAATIDPSTPDRSPSDRPSRAKPTRRGTGAADAAADLLGEANAKRAAKQWRESAALYARVVQRAPNSLAAQTALVASASLHLEHLGDPKGAAQRFRRALAIAPAGALAEDARWGLAEAARANHDAAGEAAALDDFLAHHSRSPLAQRAKARRAELP